MKNKYLAVFLVFAILLSTASECSALAPSSRLQQKDPFDPSFYHPLNLVNRFRGLKDDLPVFGYQVVADAEKGLEYPPALLELEQALTVCEVGYDNARDKKFGVLATPAGMPAINTMVDTALEHRDLGNEAEIIVIEPPYGCTENLMENWQRRGLLVHRISVDELHEKLPGLINDKTAVIYVESVTNPNLRVPAIEEVLRFNKGRAVVLVDDTFTTPEMMKSMLIDAVIDGARHSPDMAMIGLTKGATGTGNIIAGAVVAKSEWLDSLAENRNCLPEKGEVERALAGLRYLEVRFKAQSRNAAALSETLSRSDLIDFVNYPTRPDHPDSSYIRKGICIGGLMLYYVYKKVVNAADNINLLSKFRTLINAVSLGQVRTLIERPSAGTHVTVEGSVQAKGGISPAGIRGSIGIEAEADLKRETEAILNIISLYPNGIPKRDLRCLNAIFMQPYVTQEEDRRVVRYLVPKWPIPHATLEDMISDLPVYVRWWVKARCRLSKRLRMAISVLRETTEITAYDPVTIAIHHRLLWCILSGNHSSVIASPDESTTVHKADDAHMQGTFTSILKAERKGVPPIGNFSLYSRLGRPAVATLELLIAVLEFGAEKALNYDYIATSFYTEEMLHRVFLQSQAEVVMIDEMMNYLRSGDRELTEELLAAARMKDPVFYKDVTADNILEQDAAVLFPRILEDVRIQDAVLYHRFQNKVRAAIEKKGLEIVVVAPWHSPLHSRARNMHRYDAVKFRIIEPKDEEGLKAELRDTITDKTVLVFFDNLRIRGMDPASIRDIAKAKNPHCLFGITDSFNLGYGGTREDRDFDFITHALYYDNSNYGAVLLTRNRRPLNQVWHNPNWSRKGRATAMSEDTAVASLWYILPYLRVFDDRFDENMAAAEAAFSKIGQVEKVDKRHLKVTFRSGKAWDAFMREARNSILIDTKPSGKLYFYLNEWTSIAPSSGYVSDTYNIVLRVGIEETPDLKREFEVIAARTQAAATDTLDDLPSPLALDLSWLPKGVSIEVVTSP